MNAAIYIRVSTTGQEDNYSLSTQKDACRTYVAGIGATVAAVYREVHTGTGLWERPQLTALREVIRRRDIDVVIAYDLDRLARDPVHLGVILSEAEHAGVGVQFVTEPLDDSPEGQLIRFVRGYAAKVEHMQIKERTRRGKLARAASGKLLHSSRPLYGYRWRDATKAALDVDETTAGIMRGLYDGLIAGRSLRALADDLHRRGVPTATGRGVWQAPTIRLMLKSPGYKGVAYGFRWQQATERNKGYMLLHDPAAWVPLPAGTIRRSSMSPPGTRRRRRWRPTRPCRFATTATRRRICCVVGLPAVDHAAV